ncbi:hypothetical protein AACH06_25440 [Ideonella sp. DXS29W]|uniref:ATP-binding protein n=1 Tax=Ideonella lacteola TaxID=2984193 RepID=A0ABU9BYK0_9BURK
MAPKTYDDIQVSRLQLAGAYLEMLKAQPGRPLAMFAPRRVGKTFFLDNDLAPVAKKAGWLPVYADLWLQKENPLAAINHALAEALDDATVPAGELGKVAKTPVKRVGVLGASIDLGDAPARAALPASPELQFDALVARLHAASGKTVLLMLDEIQSLGEVAGSEKILAALRAVLHRRRDMLGAVFTGSSQEAMARMLATAGAPMYQFAQLLDFPALGDEYLVALANHFSKVHPGKRLDLDDLRKTFARIGFKPRLLRDLVKSMSAEGMTDFDEGVRRYIHDARQTLGWNALLQPLDAFDRLLLAAIARGKPPLGQETLKEIGRHRPVGKATIARARVAIERMRGAGLITKAVRGGARIDDPLFAEYLATAEPEDLLGG